MQLATRVDDAQGVRFKEIAKALGTTPSDALRMFVAAFNRSGGFPYEVRLARPSFEAFTSEEEANEFADRAFEEALDEAW